MISKYHISSMNDLWYHISAFLSHNNLNRLSNTCKDLLHLRRFNNFKPKNKWSLDDAKRNNIPELFYYFINHRDDRKISVYISRFKWYEAYQIVKSQNRLYPSRYVIKRLIIEYDCDTLVELRRKYKKFSINVKHNWGKLPGIYITKLLFENFICSTVSKKHVKTLMINYKFNIVKYLLEKKIITNDDIIIDKDVIVAALNYHNILLLHFLDKKPEKELPNMDDVVIKFQNDNKYKFKWMLKNKFYGTSYDEVLIGCYNYNLIDDFVDIYIHHSNEIRDITRIEYLINTNIRLYKIFK